MGARQIDFVFAEHVLRHEYASDEQVAECLALLARMRDELQLDESLAGVLVKKGYLATAQANVIEQEIDPNRAGRPKNAIKGYRLLERVGGGAMGSVYRARHLKLDVDVALKVLRVSLASSDTQIERLKREAQLAAKLSHPNIVRSLDVGESHGFHYLSMEFVEGSTVRQRLKRGPMKEKEALAIVRDVARGLEHAHAHGVVHRDVKPGNIMLSLDGTPKLADFGLARGQGPSDLTLEQSSIGTPQYVAPEQMRRGADATARSDLFSLGATLYHMVTGRPPFAGESLGEIVQNVLACRFPPPERLVPDLSVDMLYVIGRLLRGNPRQRYASATALLADLERLENGERVAPVGFRGDYEVFLQRRRRRRMLAGGAAVVAVAALVGFLVTQNISRNRTVESRKRCFAVAATGSTGIEEIESAAELNERIATMAAALRNDADCGELKPLRTRLAAAREATTVLAAAEASRQGTEYRTLDGQLAALAPTWAGPRRAVDAARADLRERSDREANRRCNKLAEVQNFDDKAALIAALDAFARDLDTRLLPLDTLRIKEAHSAAKLLQTLDEAWEAVPREAYTKYLEKREWNRAGEEHAALVDAERAARAPATDNALVRSYFDRFYRLSAPVLLQQREREDWAALTDRLPGLKPEDVVSELEQFLNRAFDYRERAKARVKSERDRVAKLRLEQRGRLNKARQQFETYAQLRFYARAAAATAELDARTWLDGTRAAAAVLQARGSRLGGLVARFLARARKAKSVTIMVDGKPVAVPGDRIRALDDPDWFEAAHKKPFRFRLRDLPRDELQRVLALVDGPVMGEWLLAEAAAANPRDAIALLDDAAAHADVALVRARRADAVQAAAQGEARATQLFASMRAAQGKRQWVDALAACNQLLRLAWTEFGQANEALLRKERQALKRQAAGGLRQRRAGVPDKNFTYDPEKGRVTIRYTGELWEHPDGPAKTRQYWSDWWTAQGLEGNFDEYYHEATHQLLDWTGMKALAGGGYACEGPDNQWLWRHRKEPVPATLGFPVKADEDWSIEFTVRWPGAVPVYFVAAAGALQGGFEFYKKMDGGGSGIMVFDAESFQKDHEKRWDRYHWKLVEAGKVKKGAADGSSILIPLDRGGANPYRMRLERRKNKVFFSVEEEGRWKKSGFSLVVKKAFSKRELAALVKDAGARFRFMGLTPFELRDVVVTGILDTDGQ